jgi:hypothetical protein
MPNLSFEWKPVHQLIVSGILHSFWEDILITFLGNSVKFGLEQYRKKYFDIQLEELKKL